MRHKLWGLSIEKLHQNVFARLFKGSSKEFVERYVQQFLTQNLNKYLYQPVLQRLKQAQQEGQFIAIISSAPDFLVQPIANLLNVNAWQATEYSCDTDGHYSHLSQIVQGIDKADYTNALVKRLGLSVSALTVYSDSYLDLPVLKIAGKAIAVAPDAVLRRVCKKNNWEII